MSQPLGEQAWHLLEEKARRATRWTLLHDVLKGVPGFVMGNGWSRNYYSLRPLAQWGAVGVCNDLGKQYPKPHVWAFLDAPFVESLRPLELTAALNITSETNRSKWHQFEGAPKLHFFKKRVGVSRQAPFDRPSLVSMVTGNALFQVMHFLGCDPIILVGMDYCYEKDAAGKLRANSYKDAERKKSDYVYRGKITQRGYVDWANEFLRIHAGTNVQGQVRSVFRLGDHGILHEIPVMEYTELEKTYGT